MNTRPIPIFIVLAAAAVSCIISLIQQVEFGTFFIRLLQSVVIFAIIGIVTKLILDMSFNKKSKEDDVDMSEIKKEEDDEEDFQGEYDDSLRNPDDIELEPEQEPVMAEDGYTEE